MHSEIWNGLKQTLKSRLNPEDYQVWIEPLTTADSSNGELVLACPNSFHRAWVRDNHLGLLREALAEVDKGLGLRLQVAAAREATGQKRPSGHRQMDLPQVGGWRPQLNQRFRFEHFVAGGGNEFAWAASRALANGKNIYTNSLFLVSGTGLGKSHLTQAVGHQVLGLAPGARVAYLTAEDFANQMIASLRAKRMDQFKDRFRRGCDVLLLEEVQFLAGKDMTQDELGYTLDSLIDAGKRVVFTGSAPPDQIKGVKPQLLSRIGSGITVPIEPPDHATRVRILERTAQAENVEVDRQVLEYLAQEITSDVRRLRSALVGLMAKGSLTGRPLDMRLASEVLGQMTSRLRRVTPEQVRDTTARLYGLPVAELTGRSRKKAVTKPRNLAMYLCRRHTEASFAAIGQIFNRDHATVMYGCDKIDREKDTDHKLAQELEHLERRLGLR